jgi:hypothetical protein
LGRSATEEEEEEEEEEKRERDEREIYINMSLFLINYLDFTRYMACICNLYS